MKSLLITFLLLLQMSAYGQLSEAEVVFVDTINNTIALTLPKDMKPSRPGIEIGRGDNAATVNVGYANADNVYQLNCLVRKNSIDGELFAASYSTIKSTFNFEYLDVLKDELVVHNGKKYYMLECKLKDGFLNATGWLELEDGSMYPSYFVFYEEAVGDTLVSLSMSYAGDMAQMGQYREQSDNVIRSYKLLTR